jgi:hypothetical protein
VGGQPKTPIVASIVYGFFLSVFAYRAYLDHTVDVVGAEAVVVVGDGDLFAVAGALVLGRDLEDAVGVDLERDFNLGNAAGSGGDSGEVELAQLVVVLGHGSLSLENLKRRTINTSCYSNTQDFFTYDSRLSLGNFNRSTSATFALFETAIS